MKKSLMTLALSLALITGAAQAATYPDVSGNWAQSDIDEVTNMRIMSGFNDGMFHPNAWVSRAEFSDMTLKTLGWAPNQAKQLPSVQKVSKNAWRFDEVDNAAWISMYPQGVYRPENPVRRVEALSALAGTLNKPLVSDAEATQILSTYIDADQIPPNLRREVATAIQYDLFAIDPRYASQIQPLQPATRADVAAMLSNLNDQRDIAITPPGSSAPVATTTTTTATRAVSGTYAEQTCENYKSSGGSKQVCTNPVPFRNSADTVDINRFGKPPAPANVQPMTTSTLPQNTIFSGTVAKALYSEFNRPGDPVVLILDHTLFDDCGKVVAPAGSRVLGEVTSVVANNTTAEVAQLGLAFHEIVTPTGQRVMINGRVASADGILRSDALQGVIVHPEHSVQALRREISTAEGAWYGTKVGKMHVLETPLTTLGDSEPVTDLDQRITQNVILGVGDRLQVMVDCPVSIQATQKPVTTQTQ